MGNPDDVLSQLGAKFGGSAAGAEDGAERYGAMLRGLIDRLILLGVLPKPEGDDYTVTWPELDEPTEGSNG